MAGAARKASPRKRSASANLAGGRLVVASNRVSVPAGRGSSAGGLAVGVQAALRDQGGVWFGWSGDLVTEPGERRVRTVEHGGITYILADLTETDHAAYYGGMANRTLWPLLHYRIDLASFEHDWFRAYLEVNQYFGQVLAEHLRPDDRVWVHDFHLIPLGHELRRRGFAGRLGFFLHVPFPPAQLFMTMPWHRELAQELCSYDSLGFQTDTDRDHFVDFARRELGAGGVEAGRIEVDGRSITAEGVPIGVDVREVERLAASAEARRHADALRSTMGSRTLIIGADRLDYSKGILERLRGFHALLTDYPEHRREAMIIQISAPSREDLPEYRDMRRSIERLVGHVNGRYGDADWVPVRYLNRTHSRRALAGYYRVARVGLVTPLRDGLNLVAQEYVVAQDAADPGALVLSRFAGAAAHLEGALVVNPYDVFGVATALHQALIMPQEERQERHQRMLAAIRANDIVAWRRRSLAALQSEPPPA